LWWAGGVVDAGGVFVGGCWVWLTAVAYLQHGEPTWRWPLLNTKPVGSATKRLCGRRREIKPAKLKTVEKAG